MVNIKLSSILLVISAVINGVNLQTLNEAQTDQIIEQAILEAVNEQQMQNVLSSQNAVPGRASAGMPMGSYMWHHWRFALGNNPTRVSQMSRNADLTMTATRNFNRLTNSAAGTISRNPTLYEQFKRRIAPYCTSRLIDPICDPHAKYRTADGTCNNLANPFWGSSFRRFKRYLPAAYDDGLETPRTRSIHGSPLRSARTISNIVHKQGSCCKAGGKQTVMFMTFGQFRDHDLTSTPTEKGPNGEALECCPMGPFSPKACFSIPIPPGDTKNMRCMNFVRSSAATESCLPGPREQVNQITGYQDASSVYGSEQSEQNTLRTFIGGRLKTSRGDLLPEDKDPDSCMTESPFHYCFNAGDKRSMEIASLTPMHVVFLRYHNKIAAQLQREQPLWSDEKLFQETRKIVSAVLQHITYNDFLPIVLGPFITHRYGIKPSKTGFRQVYDPNVDSTIANSFATAAYRFGHSLVPSYVKRVDSSYREVAKVPLNTQFNKPTFMFAHNGVVDTLRWATVGRHNGANRKLDNSVREYLFMDDKSSLDLAALNIQRGRDHGLPSYTLWRKWCRLSPVLHFGEGHLGLVDHDRDARLRLRRAYKSVHDMDLFSASLSETPLPGAVLGPTMACIVGTQFLESRDGDRFYYENYNETTGFTLGQLNEIKKINLASVFCATTNIGFIQRDVFHQPVRKSNPLLHCSNLPQINFAFWRTNTVPSFRRRWHPISPLAHLLPTLNLAPEVQSSSTLSSTIPQSVFPSVF